MNLHFSEFPYRRLTTTEIEQQANQALSDFQQTTTAQEQINVLNRWDTLLKQWESFSSIAHVQFSQNTNDENAQDERSFYDNIHPILVGQEQRLIKEVLNSPYRQTLEQQYGSNLFKTWELNLQAFDPKISSQKQQESKLTAEYTSLMAQSKVLFRGEEYSFSTMAPFYNSPDRKTRLEARISQDQALAKNQDRLDDLFNQLVLLRHQMAQNMGFESYTQLGYAEMRRTDYNNTHVAEFRRQIRQDLLPITQQILSNRADRLHISDYTFHDEGLMDLKGKIEPKGDHDWMMEQAQKMFSEMGDDFGDFFSMMSKRGLMDLKSRAGKSGGGYCTMFSDHEAPFIFANFNGTQGDVRVFTHECGHAFQGFSSRHQPLRDLIWPTYEAAEIHSMSLEFLTYPWMEKFFLDDTSRFKRSHLEGSLLFIPYGAAVDEFQHLIYTNPTASPEERNAMWQEMERTYLPHRLYQDTPYFSSGRFWQRQTHIFCRPFYYIDYCLAQVCALQFWGLAESNRPDAMQRYRHLCSLGGSKPFTKLIQDIGLQSPFTPGTIKSSIQAPLAELGMLA